MLEPKTTQEIRVLLESMGLPKDRTYSFGQFFMDEEGTLVSEKGKALTKRKGFGVRYIGILCRRVPPGPYVHYCGLWLQVWYIAIAPRDSMIWGEVFYYPERHISMYGIEHAPDPTEIEALSKRLNALAGRLSFAGANQTLPDDHKWYYDKYEAYEEELDATTEYIPMKHFAQYLGVHPDTLRDKLRCIGLPYRNLRNRQ